MLRAILIFLLIVLVLRAVWRLLEGIARGVAGPVGGPGRRVGRGPSNPAVKMVQDPVCGTFVVPGKALSLVRAGQTVYFCSAACRDAFGAR